MVTITPIIIGVIELLGKLSLFSSSLCWNRTLIDGQLAVEREITCVLIADVVIPGQKYELLGSDSVI